METEQPPKSRRPVAKWVAILLLLIIVIVVLLWYFVFRDTSPADVNSQAAKEARDEINDILNKLESKDVDLAGSIEEYKRLIQLNNHSFYDWSLY